MKKPGAAPSDNFLAAFGAPKPRQTAKSKAKSKSKAKGKSKVKAPAAAADGPLPIADGFPDAFAADLERMFEDHDLPREELQDVADALGEANAMEDAAAEEEKAEGDVSLAPASDTSVGGICPGSSTDGVIGDGAGSSSDPIPVPPVPMAMAGVAWLGP